MNRIASLLSIAALGLGSSAAYAAPKASPAAGVPQDIARAKSNPSSLFNNPSAHVMPSGTGGHIAVLYTKTSVGPTDPTVYGDKATVQIAVTDTTGYYKSGKQAPKAILANVASEKVLAGHDMNSRQAQGTNATLVRTKGGSYEGTAQISALLRQGDDMQIGLGNVGVSFAGKKGWNSEFGKGYYVGSAPGWATGTPVVNPVNP